MNKRTIAMAERALVDFIRKNQRERDYFSGRLVKAEDLPAPNQHMVSAAMRKVEWYRIKLMDLEGELEMFREAFLGSPSTRENKENTDLGSPSTRKNKENIDGLDANTDEEEKLSGEEKKNTEYDADGA